MGLPTTDPASGYSAESRTTLALLFWGYLRVDLAEIRFVLLLFSPALAIPENPCKTFHLPTLAPAADYLSPVSNAINRVIALAPAPLLPGEKHADYADVAVRVVRAAMPRDAIEEFLVRDVVDLTWEILRLRRIKAGILRVCMRFGVHAVLVSVGHRNPERDKLTDSWAAGTMPRAQKSTPFSTRPD